jgi:hypothetical protein
LSVICELYILCYLQLHAVSQPCLHCFIHLIRKQSVKFACAIICHTHLAFNSLPAMPLLSMHADTFTCPALQMHFPADYSNIDSPFEGLSALQYYVFLLTKLPQLAFTSDAYPGLKPGGAQVSNMTVALPGKEPVDGAAFLASTAGPDSSGSSGGSSSTAASAPLQVVDIDVTTLDVAVATDSVAAPNMQLAVDMSKVADTEPPRLTLLGEVLVEVLQADAYEDAGAQATDNVDGTAVTVRLKMHLCVWKDWMATAAATTNTSLACSSTAVTAVQTALPLTAASGAEQVYVLTYTAKDTAGNQAAPVRRYVTITPR